MSKQFCDRCGLRSTDPRHKPLKMVKGELLCEPCRKREEKAKEQAAKDN